MRLLIDIAQAQRDLSVSQSNLGNFYMRRNAEGDGERAFKAYEAALETRQRLARDNPQDEQALWDIIVSRERMADLHFARRTREDAVRAREYLTLARKGHETMFADNPYAGRRYAD